MTRTAELVVVDKYCYASQDETTAVILSVPAALTEGERQRHYLSRGGAMDLYRALGRALGLDEKTGHSDIGRPVLVDDIVHLPKP